MQEVIIAGVAFDETGDNYEEFDTELYPEKFGDKFTQTNPLKGSVREYQYYASEYLLLNLVDKKNAKKNFFTSILPAYLLSRNTTKSLYGNGYTALLLQVH